MAQRLSRLEADGVQELALFSLNTYYMGGGCLPQWFPLARQFLANDVAAVH